MQDRVYHQYYVGQIFYDMKFRITPGMFSSLQGNSNFMNTVDANYLIFLLTTPINVVKLIV